MHDVASQTANAIGDQASNDYYGYGNDYNQYGYGNAQYPTGGAHTLLRTPGSCSCGSATLWGWHTTSRMVLSAWCP